MGTDLVEADVGVVSFLGGLWRAGKSGKGTGVGNWTLPLLVFDPSPLPQSCGP